MKSKPFDWTEYLDLAEYLSGKSDTYTQEAALRSATSRAYYAAFRSARDVAEQRLGFEPKRTGEDHGLVKDHFRLLGMKQIADKLAEMHWWRTQCDYDEHVKNLHTIVSSAIRRAKEVLKAVKKKY